MPQTGVEYGRVLWEPPPQRVEDARITDFVSWINAEKGTSLREAHYDDLWRWSIDHLAAFWQSVVEYFDLDVTGEYATVVDGPIHEATWFKGTSTNFGQHVLDGAASLDEAIIGLDETGGRQVVSGADLQQSVARLATLMRDRGIRQGDVVASYMPNIPETIVAFLATTSLGAVWTSCSPDFGRTNVIDRFSQVDPKLLFVVDGYHYGGNWHDRRATVKGICDSLPSLESAVAVKLGPWGFDADRNIEDWKDLLETVEAEPITWDRVPFEHPLWVLYSSGTTGPPKAIVHSHGGILLELMKANALQLDLSRGDRFFWFTTTGWVMWNILLSALLCEATIVLYDGDLNWPDSSRIWRMTEQNDLTYVGLSAGQIHAAMKQGVHPAADHDLSRLRTVGSTGSPLSPEGYAWLYDAVKRDMLVSSISGGTDIASAFVSGAPVLPVYAGEIQRPALAADIAAFDPDGRPLIGQTGELVVRNPMPSMPTFLWGDTHRERLRASYFGMFPDVWRHGDWIQITERGTCVVYGRSDATLNRGGVRMGTSEFYRVLEAAPEIEDSLVVDTGAAGRSGELLLFVAMAAGKRLEDEDKQRLSTRIVTELSPRHRPDAIFQVSGIPRTLSGKRMEVPVKRILSGESPEGTVSEGAMRNPDVLREFLDIREHGDAPSAS